MKYSKEPSSNLKDVFKQINKSHGEDTIGFASENKELEIETWDTGCFSLNHILGNGGLAKGRVYEMFGNFSAGKTTAALYLLAQIQKQGGKIAMIDAEFSFNADHAKKLGINIEELIFAQPENGEVAFDLIEKLIHTGEVAAIVVDSTAALVPSKELEGDITDHNIGLQARIISKGLRMITGAVAKTKTIVIFISQVRAKIGSFVGPTTESSGGNALKFYTSVRLEVTKIKTIKDGDKVIGNRLKITAVKNKVAAPFGSAEVDLYFDSGFDLYGEALEFGEKMELIEKMGHSYSFHEEKLGIGKDNAKLYLMSHNDTYEKLRKEIRESILKKDSSGEEENEKPGRRKRNQGDA